MNISIITATYNSQNTILDTIDSISNQTYKNFEHIVIDGQSQDKTCAIIKEQSPSSILISEKDSGIYDAMNKGIKKTTGEIVSILNSDDVYYDESVLETVAKQFETSDIDVLYGHILFFAPLDKTKVVRVWKTGTVIKFFIWLGWIMPHPAVFVRKKIYEEIGDFDTSFRHSSDYDFLLRLIKSEKYKIKFCDKFLVRMRIGGASDLRLFRRIKEWWILIKIFKKNYGIYPIWFFITRPLFKLKQFFKSI